MKQKIIRQTEVKKLTENETECRVGRQKEKSLSKPMPNTDFKKTKDLKVLISNALPQMPLQNTPFPMMR